MDIKHKFALLAVRAFLGMIFLLIPASVSAQKKAKDNNIRGTIKVVDEQGKIIPGATVIIGEGVIHAITDVNGEYTFKGRPSAPITVIMAGFDKYSGFVAQLATDGRVILKEATFLKSSDDLVHVPFSSTYKRYTTDNLSTLTSDDLSKYPTADLRNAMVGLIPGYISTEKDGQPGLSAEESTGKYGISEKVVESTRGKGLVYVVDDIQVDMSEMPLDPDEIESVTLVKDPVTKSLYGPAAANGVLYIKTKRGRPNERKIRVNMEAGVSIIDRFPEYATGVDYARLNNRARVASGLDPLYTDDALATYAKNNPFNMLYPNNNYRDMLFKNTRSYQRVNVSSLGGNHKVQYGTYVGYTGEGDIYKIGSTADYNRLNVRTNLDVKLSDIIKIRFDFAGGLNIRRSPNYGSEEEINEFTALIDHANNTSPVAFPVYAGVSETTGRYNYAISKAFSNNPVGGLEGNGQYTEMNRSGIGNVALDIDFSHLVKGLKSTSYIGFNGSYLTRVGKNEQYAAYYVLPNEEAEEGYSLEKVRGETLVSGKSKLHDYFSVRYTAYEKLSYERAFNQHQVQAGLLIYMNQLTRKGYREPVMQANGIFNASYIYNDRYVFQGVVNYVGSNYYAKKNRYKMFPTIGAAWILSDEKFMKSAYFVDFLKIRTQLGRLGAISYKTANKYESDWSSSAPVGFGYPGGTASDWLGTNTSSASSTTYTTSGNPNLDWEYWDEFTAGAELMMFKRKLAVDVAYYNRTQMGIIDQVTNHYPAYMGIHVLPYLNYGKTRYSGWEMMLSWQDKIGDLKYKIGLNANHGTGKHLKIDEPNYPDREKWYRKRTGYSTGSIYGLVCLGKYASDEEAFNDPLKSSYSADLKKGDLRYKDMNGDGIINDNDMTRIADSQPKLYYALNLQVEYKGIELSAVGTGVAGRKEMLSGSYYRGGSGENNYSTWIRDNIGGDYPRLSYYKVEHNFQNSSFWVRNTSYFKLQNIELAYNLPAKICNNWGVGAIRIFARGANLLTLSGIKETDPESINSGIDVYPLYSTYVGGLKVTF